MTDFVTRLARKWCPNHSNKRPNPPAVLEKYPPCYCDAIAPAIREALEEAEKIALNQAEIWNPDDHPSGNQASRYIATALRALREGE